LDISTLSQNAQQHPAAASMYVRHGWKLCQIPFGSKGPTTPNWNQPGNWIESTEGLPPTFNMGLLHAYSGTMALDIDDFDASRRLLAEIGIDLDALFTASDAVTIDSGKPGHGKLLYAMPFGLVLPSKKVNANGSVALELRCSTSSATTVQDVLPPSRHPETGKLYQWGGNGRWDRLPTIPTALLNYWQSHLKTPEPQHSQNDHTSTSLDDVRSALETLDASCPRDEWRDVGMGLHHLGATSDILAECFDLWDEWSAKSPEKYPGRDALLKQWTSFKIIDNGITIGTLFDMALKAGWAPPTPDVAPLFEKKPVDVFAGMRPAAPDVDLSLIPEPLASRAQAISTSVGCDPLGPLFAGLGVVCAAADSRIKLQLAEGFEVPPILWLMSIGAPSDKKSPGTRPMFSVLHEIEREDRPDYKRRLTEWKVQNEYSKQQFQAYLDHSMEMLNGLEQPENTVAPDLPDEPVKPQPLLLMVQDITSQKLLHHGANNPRGLLCYLDEMKGWTDQLTNKHSHENRSTWIAGFEGGAARMDRVGAGEIVADPFSVSVFGNIQPDVWRSKLLDLSSDGFIARFVPAVLRPNLTKLPEPLPDAQTFRAEYEKMIRMVYALPIQTYRLSPEAATVFREQQRWTIERGHEDRLLEQTAADKSFSYSFHKGDGTVARLALVFHLMTEPFNPLLSGETMRRARDFWQTYIVPSLRYAYWEIGDQSGSSFDVWLASHIIYIADHEKVSLRDLKRSGRRQLQDYPAHHHDSVVMDAMLALESCSWVSAPVVGRTSRSTTWFINPELRKTFADYRKQVAIIKQKRADEMREIAMRHRPGQEIPRRLVPGYKEEWD